MKTFLRILGAFAAGFAVVIAGFLISSSIYPNPEDAAGFDFGACVAGLIVIVALIVRAIKKLKNPPSATASLVSRPLPMPKESAPSAPPSPSYITKISKATMELLSGLNIPQGVKCLVEATGTTLSISALRQTYVIQNKQIRAVSIQTVSEMQKQYVSSVGGAVAGAMLFGGLGAIIGGAAKQKSIRSDTKLFIISYESGEGDIQYVIFKLNPGSLSTAPERIVRSYKDLTKNTRTVVEL